MATRLRMIAAVLIFAGGYFLSSPQTAQAFDVGCPTGDQIVLDCAWCGDMTGCSISSCRFDNAAHTCGCNYTC